MNIDGRLLDKPAPAIYAEYMAKDRYHINGDCEHLGHVFSPTDDARWQCVLCKVQDYSFSLNPAAALSQKCLWETVSEQERAKHTFLACYCPKCMPIGPLDGRPRLI